MLVEYIPSLIAAGIILVPVILWSDVLTGWFKSWFNGRRDNQFLYVLAVTLGGALILWLLSYLRGPQPVVNGSILTPFITLFSLAVIFFVASTWANVIRDLIASSIRPGENSGLWYLILATVVPVLLIWLMGYMGLFPDTRTRYRPAGVALPGMTIGV